ncbi:MAG: EF-P beta-lysylation protein EpmB [Lysobacterales bacterium]
MNHATSPAIHQLSQLPEQVTTDDSRQQAAEKQFPVRIPDAFADLIDWNNPADPLLAQVLPDPREMTGPGSKDPVGELDARQAGGLVHKYAGRALLVVTSSCDIHCRYCFRRHFPYADEAPPQQRWVDAVDYLVEHPEVTEVILSGGDPLTLSNRRLQALGTELRRLPQLRRLRIHSRTPVVKPQRVDKPLLQWLSDLPWPTSLVLHCNHANELGSSATAALAELRSTGVSLLNQSVLLKGVNDDVQTLVALSENLFDIGVLPYYLHLLDPVQGAAHFALTQAQARPLIEQMRQRLPGYLVPRLVCDPGGTPSKQIIA